MAGRKKTGGKVIRNKATTTRKGVVSTAELAMLRKPVREQFLANTKKIGADPMKALNKIVSGYNSTFA